MDSTAALPLQNFLAALIFGRWFWRGFLVTSDLNGFDSVIATIAAQLKQKYGEQGFAARFVEEQPTWQLQMLNAPVETIRAVVVEESLPLTQRDAIWHAVSFLSSHLLPMIVSAIVHWQIPWAQSSCCCWQSPKFHLSRCTSPRAAQFHASHRI